jgi:ribonuclease III family protein
VTSDEQGHPGVLDAGLASSLLGVLVSQPVTLAQVQRLSPSALAYLGDAVYELQVRRCYLLPPRKLEAYHQDVVAQVRAESQANSLRSLQPHLTELELEILKRGRNAAYNRPKRVDPDIYQQATSLETLVGYLYLTDLNRLLELFSHLELSPPQN